MAVYNQKRTYRTQFRKIVKGGRYWLASSLNVAPSVKLNGGNNLAGFTQSTGAPIVSAVADRSVAVVRVPQTFAGGTRFS